jgi:cytidylate kinase
MERIVSEWLLASMNAEILMNKSGSFIASQAGEMKERSVAKSSPAPSVTISQQTGSGAHEIAERTAEILERSESGGRGQWKVYDRQLVERALEEHHLPQRIAKHMREDRRSCIQDVTEELFGLRPPSWVLVPMVVETVLHLIKAGHVIVVGRGATAITSRMPGVFHVRVVASLPRRIERVQHLRHLTREESAQFIEQEDRGAQRYVKAHFHTRIEDDLLYHLVINTDRVPYADAAMLLADGAGRCFKDSERFQDRHRTN